MAVRTPLRAKQPANAQPQAFGKASKPLASPRKPVDPLLVFGDKKRKQDDVVDLCTTEAPAKVTSPAAKRARPDVAPAVPLLERGKKSKARKEKDEALRNDVSASREQWQRKYRTAFRTFVFYFDAIEGAKQLDMTRILLELGSNIEPFFSKDVTHVVTTRSLVPSRVDAMVVDVDADKENAVAVAVPVIATLPKLPLGTKRRSPMKQPPIPVQANHDDVLTKATALGIKIWDLKKFNKVVNELLDANSPTKAGPPKPLSLPKLLRDEQISGVTRERDPEVLRPDYHYFATKGHYVLVEDSTGIHRPILVKEYHRVRAGQDAEWPTLFGGSEGRTAFSRPHGYVLPAAPANPLPLAHRTIALAKDNAVNLRKSVSLNQLHKRHAADAALAPAALIDSQVRHGEASGFLAASGNSISLTSNIASVTSGAPSLTTGSGFAGHGPIDKRLTDLNKRQVLSTGSNGVLAHFGVRKPNELKRSMSIDSGLSARNPLAREQPAKPGYCENCRVRYDDFKEHVVSNRHRKFARNAANWLSLDDCLRKIERPLAPEVLQFVESDHKVFADIRRQLRLADADKEDITMASSDEEAEVELSDEDDEDDEEAEGAKMAVGAGVA